MKNEFLKFMKEGNFSGTKEWLHKYVSNYYCDEFENKRAEELTIIEIGVRDGADLALFSDWFHMSKIYGIDINNIIKKDFMDIRASNGDGWYNTNVTDFKNFQFILGNAYKDSVVSKFEDNSLDYLIDDGSHTLGDQIKCIEKYLPKMKIGGKMIIEDVGCREPPAHNNPSAEKCIKAILDKAEESGCTHRTIDLRKQTKSTFSIIIEIKKME